ncbi:transglycosylase SLT domain-containing protein [Desulfocurvus sp. DL9XJH121]
MDPSRRHAVKAMVAAALAPAVCAVAGAVPAPAAALLETPINVMVPRTWSPPLDGKQGRLLQARLGRAILEAVRANYKGRTLPVWKQRYGSMDLEKRVTNICLWIVRSVRAHHDVYPVDPVWVAAQIMTESFFYEFAVSRALAVGICQFIPATAAEYGMTCGGTRPEHSSAPYALPQWAREVDNYYQRRADWKKAMRRRNKVAGDATEYLREALSAGRAGEAAPRAGDWLAADAEAQGLDDQVKESRSRYRRYLRENFKGRSIFDDKDVRFFKAFDERVLYKRPVDAMVLMLARFLRARNGNILSAAAGYHCGLGNTREDGDVYGRYGRIPGFDSTVSYVSRILVNHHEIALRMA